MKCQLVDKNDLIAGSQEPEQIFGQGRVMAAMGLKAEMPLCNLSHINLICLKLEAHWEGAPTSSTETSFSISCGIYHDQSLINIVKQKRGLDHGVSIWLIISVT